LASGYFDRSSGQVAELHSSLSLSAKEFKMNRFNLIATSLVISLANVSLAMAAGAGDGPTAVPEIDAIAGVAAVAAIAGVVALVRERSKR
jgi:hypothetical protein